MSKFYVVWAGRVPGIYTSWKEAEAQVSNFPQAKFKSYPSEVEAKEAFSGSPFKGSIKKKTSEKKTAPLSSIMPEMDIHIFCDGGCEPNPGKSGSGVVVYEHSSLKSLHYGLYSPNGTNNSAELGALHEALRLAKILLSEGQSVQILADSMYAIQCITKWADSWKRNNWTKKDGEIKNLEVIQAAHELYVELKDKVIVSHIKAHAGFEGNELADRMTMLAIDKKETGFKMLQEPVLVEALLAMRKG